MGTVWGRGRDLWVCAFICVSVLRNDPIYFKYKPRFSNFGAGMLAVPCTADFVSSLYIILYHIVSYMIIILYTKD